MEHPSGKCQHAASLDPDIDLLVIYTVGEQFANYRLQIQLSVLRTASRLNARTPGSPKQRITSQTVANFLGVDAIIFLFHGL